MYRLNGCAPESTVEAVRREFTEALEKAKGEDGRNKRDNAEKLRQAWEQGGEGWPELSEAYGFTSVNVLKHYTA